MIRLENVTKTYGTEIPAVRDASFEIAKGDFVFMVGPSGSGKERLAEIIQANSRRSGEALFGDKSDGTCV